MLFRRGNTCRHRVLISHAKLIRRQYASTLIKYDRYRCIQQRLFKCDRVRKDCGPVREGSRQPRTKHDSRVVPVKHAKGIRDREAFEGQRLANFPRAGRMTGFLVVGGLWKGGCYFGDARSTIRKVRVRHEFT